MKNINKVLLIIISIFIVLYIVTIIILNNRTKTIIVERNSYKTKLDSLNTEINTSKLLVKTYEIKIDSLYKTKNQITNNYETNIQNLSNPNVISDDSITNYIKTQISK